MDILIQNVYRASMYILFGVYLEVSFIAITRLCKWLWKQIKKLLKGQKPDQTIPEDVKEMRGNISLWMIFVYGISILFIYEPIYKFLQYYDINIIIRYIIWGVSIASIEAFWGFIFDKVFKIMPWSYEKCIDKVFNRGYTRYSYIFMWGIVGLFLEFYYPLVYKLSLQVPYIIKIIVR